MQVNNERLALTGDGADEILGGYPRYELIEKVPKLLARVLFHISKILPDREFYEIRNKLHQLFIHHYEPMFWLYWHSIFNENKLEEYIEGGSYNYARFLKMLEQSLDAIDTGELERKRYQHLMNMDHKLWLPNESNRRLDRVSMAVSIEARSPFQDENVIQIAGTINKNFRAIKKKNYLFRQYPELEKLGITQEKQGFISPIGFWLRNNMELINESMDLLNSVNITKSLNLKNLVSGVTGGHYESIQQVWNLVVLAAWININEK
jgi:asparagine synthase (glutamine-hydrolysing)